MSFLIEYKSNIRSTLAGNIVRCSLGSTDCYGTTLRASQALRMFVCEVRLSSVFNKESCQVAML